MGLSAHLRPLTDSMALAYSHDPDFDQETNADGQPYADGEAYMLAFKSATERLDYARVTKSGGQPTLFYFRPLTDAETRRIRGLGDISDAQLAALVVRMTLERVEHGGELAKIERKVDPEFPGFGKLITTKYMDVLGGVSVSLGRPQGEITNQLGLHVFLRSLNLDPK